MRRCRHGVLAVELPARHQFARSLPRARSLRRRRTFADGMAVARAKSARRAGPAASDSARSTKPATSTEFTPPLANEFGCSTRDAASLCAGWDLDNLISSLLRII